MSLAGVYNKYKKENLQPVYLLLTSDSSGHLRSTSIYNVFTSIKIMNILQSLHLKQKLDRSYSKLCVSDAIQTSHTRKTV